MKPDGYAVLVDNPEGGFRFVACYADFAPAHTEAERLNGRVQEIYFMPPTGKKLTDEQVREMRARHKAGESIRSLARYYRVSFKRALDIIDGKAWKHVEE